MKPSYRTKNSVLYHGNALDVLKGLPDGSVHSCISSPPYFNLRSYLDENDPNKEMEVGIEKTPEEFVSRLVEIYREVRRVLRDDGNIWINLGDSYSEGNLVGIPWRVALALQSDGWVLRQDIIWSKPACMPESVQNRCTKSHEYIFLLVKQAGYFYDGSAIKEKSVDPPGKNRKGSLYAAATKGSDGSKIAANNHGGGLESLNSTGTANKRSVWTVASEGNSDLHFAPFPQKLVQPMVLAGTSAKGCCAECGSPYKRIVEKEKLKRERPNDYVKRTGEKGTGNSCANTVAGVEVKTLGWEKTCSCSTNEIKPCTILDMFAGTSTTGVVALKNGRRFIGIDLNDEYLKISHRRLQAAETRKGFFAGGS